MFEVIVLFLNSLIASTVADKRQRVGHSRANVSSILLPIRRLNIARTSRIHAMLLTSDPTIKIDDCRTPVSPSTHVYRNRVSAANGPLRITFKMRNNERKENVDR